MAMPQCCYLAKGIFFGLVQPKFLFGLVNSRQEMRYQEQLLNSVQLQFVEHSNRRKMKSYSMRRKNSISAIIFIWLYLVAISILVVWLGRFARFAE